MASHTKSVVMPPLTSPSGYDSCLRLTQKVTELEGRISVLYQIRDDELILDSLCSVCPDAMASAPKAISTDSEVSVGCAATVSAVCELDSTVPCLEATDRWAQQGAKLKHPPPTSSTPGPWITACRGKHGGKLRSDSHTGPQSWSF